MTPLGIDLRENARPYHNVYMNVPGGFVYNSQHFEMTSMFFCG